MYIIRLVIYYKAYLYSTAYLRGLEPLVPSDMKDISLYSYLERNIIYAY